MKTFKYIYEFLYFKFFKCILCGFRSPDMWKCALRSVCVFSSHLLDKWYFHFIAAEHFLFLFLCCVFFVRVDLFVRYILFVLGSVVSLMFSAFDTWLISLWAADYWRKWRKYNIYLWFLEEFLEMHFINSGVESLEN